MSIAKGAAAGVLALALTVATVSGAGAGASSTKVVLHQLSSDPFTNKGSQHHTEVEPASFAAGSTVVTAFQTGRFTNGGSSDIGWARSINAGKAWRSGFLPGITRFYHGGSYDRASNPSVAYDARHKTWLITSLGIRWPAGATAPAANDVIVSRSVDNAAHWQAPVQIETGTVFDKDWITCDNRSTSPNYGNCYTEYQDTRAHEQLHVSVTSDGGRTWSPAIVPADVPVLGGQPVARRDGVVVMPILLNGYSRSGTTQMWTLENFTSSADGRTYTQQAPIHAVKFHEVAGPMRAFPLPSAAADAAGTVYVVWSGCEMRATCNANDLLFSTTSDGVTWSTARTIRIDGPSVDHFLPALAVDPSTHGPTAHLALTYYFYPDSSCVPSTCRLDVGFIRSNNGGKTWTARTQIAGPMKPTWLANTTLGRMIGDYVSTSFVNHVPRPFLAIAHAPSKGKFNEAIFTSR